MRKTPGDFPYQLQDLIMAYHFENACVISTAEICGW